MMFKPETRQFTGPAISATPQTRLNARSANAENTLSREIGGLQWVNHKKTQDIVLAKICKPRHIAPHLILRSS